MPIGLSRDPTRETLTGQSKRSETLSDTLLTPGAKDAAKKKTVLTGRLGEKVAKQLQKAEKIKQRKLARQAQVGQGSQLHKELTVSTQEKLTGFAKCDSVKKKKRRELV